jgi:hypothetical protein
VVAGGGAGVWDAAEGTTGAVCVTATVGSGTIWPEAAVSFPRQPASVMTAMKQAHNTFQIIAIRPYKKLDKYL